MGVLDVIITIWTVACTCMIFKKIGIQWWKGLIPVYNIGLFYKYITGKFWIGFWVLIFASMSFWFGAGEGFVEGFMEEFKGSSYTFDFPDILEIIIELGFLLVMLFYTFYKLAKAFDKNGGWCVWYVFGLMTFTYIFLGVLAFGQSKYIGFENITWNFKTKKRQQETYQTVNYVYNNGMGGLPDSFVDTYDNNVNKE
ncbi:MAG: hypothetical protein LBM02_06410 [Lachnospiraceae bacterium]|jgi:hypothetical protein|nr:hypothetical protein [Lachnospiraceae bacterium]